MKGNLLRATEGLPERFVIEPGGIGPQLSTDDTALLDDAGVAAILEGTELPQDRERIAPASAAATGSLLNSIVAATILVVVTIIGFVSIASGAPAAASALFVVFLVLTPAAIAALIREESALDQARNAGRPQTAERS